MLINKSAQPETECLEGSRRFFEVEVQHYGANCIFRTFFPPRIWSPSLAQDIQNYVSTLKYLLYTQRLLNLNLTTLTERREKRRPYRAL